MSTELRVLVAHLGELAAKHGEAAGRINAAIESVDGVDVAVGKTHGPISAVTANAVAAAAHARRNAGARTESVSRDLQGRLRESAVSYTDTDETAGVAVGGATREGNRT